jgi:hypothetical protein
MQDGPRTSGISALGWAAFLAASWTWCIGMFLPVLLIRDFGSAGFWVFLVPNVVGAGAMGWVLWANGGAERIVRDHRAAASAFSAVTLAFQAFFLGWLAVRVNVWATAPDWVIWTAVFLGLIVLVATLRLANHAGAIRALAGLLIVYGVAALFVMTFVSAHAPTTAQFAASSHRSTDLLWISPMILFGFALCPYLDLTFLRARTATSSSGAKLAFTLGFGVLFAAMLLLTYQYAGLFIASLSPTRQFANAVPWVWAVLLSHLAMQAAFTLALHARAAQRIVRVRVPIAAIAVASFALGYFSFHLPGAGGMNGPEVVYRCFMGCYGLAFPAYVWLVMIPTRDGHAGIAGPNGKRKLLILAFAVGVAMPMTWMAFIERDEIYAVPGMLVVLLSRLALPRRSTGAMV